MTLCKAITVLLAVISIFVGSLFGPYQTKQNEIRQDKPRRRMPSARRDTKGVPWFEEYCNHQWLLSITYGEVSLSAMLLRMVHVCRFMTLGMHKLSHNSPQGQTPVHWQQCNYGTSDNYSLQELPSAFHKIYCWYRDLCNWNDHIDGLVQDCSISNALTMDILQTCTMT